MECAPKAYFGATDWPQGAFQPGIHATMTLMTMVFGREKSFRLGESSFPIPEVFSLGLKSRTKYQYDPQGRLSTVTAYNADGSTVTPQTTTYLYTSAVNASWQTGVVYPDTAAPANFLTVTSLAQSGGTATAQVANSYAVDQWVCISGANEAAYDGWVQIASRDANSFTFVLPADVPTPPTPATGDIQVRALGQDLTTTDCDRLGRKTADHDQRGVTHQYAYDSAGRLAADIVTSLGPTDDPSRVVDGSIRRIGTTYDDVGRVEYVTSYSDTSGGEDYIANQIKYEYDGWGNVSSEFQEHNGQVNDDPTYGSSYVEYDYGDGSDGTDAYHDAAAGFNVAKYVRLSDVTYPYKDMTFYPFVSPRTVYYDYSADTTDNIMSRVESIYTTGNEANASYKYLGAQQIVKEDYTDIDVKLDYSANNFAALDRFGRVRDQFWSDYGSDPSYSDHFTYMYDREGNVTSRVNAIDAAFSETYGYDDLNRLTWAKRNGVDLQSWGLDAAGNMSSVTTGGTTQTRDANAANEISSIDNNPNAVLYDAAGNMISGPQPGNETTQIRYVYDAWNRLAAVKADDGTLIAAYQYDGVNRRISKTDVNGTTDNYYYNQNWQMVEDRNGGEYTGLPYVEQYLWNPGGGDSPMVCLHDGSDYWSPPNGDTSDDYPTDWRTYYTTDANGNVTTTIRVDQYNDVTFDGGVSRNVYTPYGTVTRMARTGRATVSKPTPMARSTAATSSTTTPACIRSTTATTIPACPRGSTAIQSATPAETTSTPTVAMVRRIIQTRPG